MTDWADLIAELDVWGGEGRTATFWWRDDDAVAATPTFATLTALSVRRHVPLAIAVIPACAEPSLAAACRVEPNVTVLQHGFSHANHAPAFEKKSELGAHRDPDAVLGDVRNGMKLLSELGFFALPVLVPPWNRISREVITRLPEVGISGLSTFRPRDDLVGGLTIVNTHADIIDWRGARGFVGCGPVLDQMLEHLVARRTGRADSAEATGLLTHHLVHDEECWQFLDELFSLTTTHAAVRWLGAPEIFAIDATG